MKDWPERWSAADPRHVDGMAQQLRREVGVGHVLKGLNVRLIARRDGYDDALFQLDDGRVADVHMTWRQDAETDPRWPATGIFPNLENWRAAAATAYPDDPETD